MTNSSPANIAAYINTLTYNLEDSGKISKNPWKINHGTFCCFNAFSRVDVRIEVKIPGTVEAYIVDLKGERQVISGDKIWQELFLSSLLRAILDDSDEPESAEAGFVVGLRKLDPFTNPSVEKRFLEAAKDEFWKGWQLGTDPEVQIATYFSNHLSNGLVKYFVGSGRVGEATKFFEELYPTEPEVGALLANMYLDNDEEVKAVKTLYDSVKRQPTSYGLLLAQIDFLRRKSQHKMALQLAQTAVSLAPSEFCTWAKLTEVYMDLKDYESALLTLNSCPMFTYVEKDAHRMPTPARVHIPLKPDPSNPKQANLPGDINGTLFDENDPKENEVHPELIQLPSLNLRGTFKKAYALIIRMVSEIGWDDLLKFRSTVFVMEEEYRVHRAVAEEKEKEKYMSSKTNGDEGDVKDEENTENKENEENEETETEKEGKKDGEATGDDEDEDDDKFLSPTTGESVGAKSMDKEREPVKKDGEEKPISPVSPTAVKSEDGDEPAAPIKNKRLCERWLDNLFMVLYNDLRIYTAIKAEINHYKINAARTATNSSLMNILLYRKTGAEWEMYGDLCLRLLKKADALEAYRLCLEQKLSLKALLRLLEMYTDEGNIQLVLGVVVKLVEVLDRAYVDHTYPSLIGKQVFRIIRRHGLAKVQNVLISMNVPQKSFKLVTRFFDFAEAFRVEGVSW